MDNIIKNAAISLQSINQKMVKIIEGKNLSFDEAWEFLATYRDYKDAHALMEQAEALAHQDLDALFGAAQELLSASGKCLEIYDAHEEQLSQYSFQTICDQHLEPYNQAWRRVSDEANELWGKTQELYRKLDWMDRADPNFAVLDKQYDTLMAQYQTKKKEYEGLFATYREKQKRISGLSFFDIALIRIVASKLHSLAEGIIADINRIRKEDGV